MSSSTYNVTEAQAGFTKVSKTKGVVTVTDRKGVRCFIVSKEFMAAAFETQEILASAPAMKAIREYKSGKTKFGALDEISD